MRGYYAPGEFVARVNEHVRRFAQRSKPEVEVGGGINPESCGDYYPWSVQGGKLEGRDYVCPRNGHTNEEGLYRFFGEGEDYTYDQAWELAEKDAAYYARGLSEA